MTAVEKISSTTLSSPTSDILFSSIPSNYQDIFISASGATSALQNIVITLNNDSASGMYSYNLLYAYQSSVSSFRTSSNMGHFQPDYYASFGYPDLGYFSIDIMSYSSSNITKTIMVRGLNVISTSGGRHIGCALYYSTNPINSIKISAQTRTFLTGSSFSLWGIK